VPMYVISGGPFAGKSTTIALLEKRGLSVVHEISKPIIDEYVASNGGKPPWKTKDCEWFQKEVFRKQLLAESKVDEGVVFLESALPDRVAISELEGVNIPSKIKKLNLAQRYRLVFFLDALPDKMYRTDTHRPGSIKNARAIRAKKELVYKRLGYSLIPVPFLSAEKRVDFILEMVRHD